MVEDYHENEPIPGQGPGREELKKAYQNFNTPFPDLEFVFADVIAEGDLVVGRGLISGTHKGEFFGVPPTGKKVHWTGTRLFRLKDGKITEGWVNLDMMGLMQQMGIVPSPPPGPEPAPAKHLTGAPSTRDANKELMRRFIEEVWNKGNTDVADEVFHPRGHESQRPGPAARRGRREVHRRHVPEGLPGLPHGHHSPRRRGRSGGRALLPGRHPRR